jgi:sulfur carrier protein ThiS
VKVTVKLSRNNETKNIQLGNGSDLEDVLKKLNLKPDTVIIMNDNKPVPIDEEIKDGEEFTILQVSSGG